MAGPFRVEHTGDFRLRAGKKKKNRRMSPIQLTFFSLIAFWNDSILDRLSSIKYIIKIIFFFTLDFGFYFKKCVC
jgi:hypothetical protein